ncbi:MAG: glutaminyl-peptide cyclotransferase [Gammaproteobacteria bacterium]|nr:glutaminyl-peptide cyclotransferase [Gammaproteobacteria bacterium]
MTLASDTQPLQFSVVNAMPVTSSATARRYTYRIVNTYPHDPAAFTQGLVFTDDIFYEGTGLNGKSTLRAVVPETGEILLRHALSESLFGEGITVYGDEIIQLTWQAGTGFVYRKTDFTLLREFQYPTEGWGITHDGAQLIMSDGSAALSFLDPVSFARTSQIEVHDDYDRPIYYLNELEYVQGEIYANIWQTEQIARISPQTGRVLGWIDLEGLLDQQDLGQGTDVLNGIAYDAIANRLFVTGKLWPKIFEIELLEIPDF